MVQIKTFPCYVKDEEINKWLADHWKYIGGVIDIKRCNDYLTIIYQVDPEPKINMQAYMEVNAIC